MLTTRMTLFCLLLMLANNAFSQTDTTLDLAVRRYPFIRNTIIQLKKSGLDTLRGGEKFPVLTALGKIHINQPYDSVLMLLGKPLKAEEIDDVLVLTYSMKSSKMVKIGIGKGDRVVHIITNSEILIPEKLGVGNRIEQFETIYGSRRYRKTEPIGLSENFYIYPLSNLSLIADSKTRIVKIIMITKSN